MRRRERDVQRDVIGYLERYPEELKVWRANAGAAYDRAGRLVRFGAHGQADLTGLVADGRRLEIETKAPGKGLRLAQRTYRDGILALGGIYIVVHSLVELREQLRDAGVPPWSTEARP